MLLLLCLIGIPITSLFTETLGRAGRAGREGEAVTFFTEADVPLLRQCDQTHPFHYCTPCTFTGVLVESHQLSRHLAAMFLTG